MKVGTTVSSPWRYLAEARVDRKGVEESWEEMVSWLSWLFELVYLKRASSASTLTWCCSRRWHISILFILTHTHTRIVTHTVTHRHMCTHSELAFLQPPRCVWHSTHDPEPRGLWAVRLTGYEEVDMWHRETGSNVSSPPWTKKQGNERLLLIRRFWQELPWSNSLMSNKIFLFPFLFLVFQVNLRAVWMLHKFCQRNELLAL